MHRRCPAGPPLALAIIAMFAMGIDQGTYTSSPPCTDTPMGIMGEFDGVLYNPDIPGQMFACWSELCVNTGITE